MKARNGWVSVIGAVVIFSQAAVVARGTGEVAQATSEVSDLVVETPIGDLPTGQLTGGARGGNEFFEPRFDLLFPLYSSQQGGLLFLNPRVSLTDGGAQELNLGLGYRHYLVDERVILGANMFYDSRCTKWDNQFDQLGFGLEVLSETIDVRANMYFPEDSKEFLYEYETRALVRTRVDVDTETWTEGGVTYAQDIRRTLKTYQIDTYSVYEVPLEGFDAEIGYRLPLGIDEIEARVFAGYYEFQPQWKGDIGVDEIDGFKARVELRAMSAFIFDLEVYENDDLYGADVIAGVRVQLPFDLASLARGRNPFVDEYGSNARPFIDRLVENVMRDPHIIISEQTARQTRFQSRRHTSRTEPRIIAIEPPAHEGGEELPATVTRHIWVTGFFGQSSRSAEPFPLVVLPTAPGDFQAPPITRIQGADIGNYILAMLRDVQDCAHWDMNRP